MAQNATVASCPAVKPSQFLERQHLSQVDNEQHCHDREGSGSSVLCPQPTQRQAPPAVTHGSDRLVGEFGPY
jgi:hypothetical protein